MNNLKLQINSLEALERLIGGDSEVEIDIRNSVVQKFAEKHLKAVANSDQINTVINSLKNEIAKQIQEKCSNEIASFKQYYAGGSPYDIKIRPEVSAEIDRHVRNTISTIISKAVGEAEEKLVNAAEIEKRIRTSIDHNINVRINQEVKARLDAIKATL